MTFHQNTRRERWTVYLIIFVAIVVVSALSVSALNGQAWLAGVG